MIEISKETHPNLYFDYRDGLKFLNQIDLKNYEYPDEIITFHIYTEIKNDKELECVKSYLATQNLNKSSSGSGPDARPPKVFKGAPAGLILDKFHLGIWPAANRKISSFKALAQPSLESDTIITVSVSKNSSLIIGSLFTY